MQKVFSPLTITIAFIIVTTGILFPFFTADLVQKNGWWNQVTAAGIISILYSGVIATIVTYVLNQYVIKHGGPILATMTFYLNPIFAFFSAAVLLGE